MLGLLNEPGHAKPLDNLTALCPPSALQLCVEGAAGCCYNGRSWILGPVSLLIRRRGS